jgi:hypothetical protein
MAFPSQVKETALLSCGRHCCLCHKFCGLKIELHHIVHASEGGDDTLDNCIPLCFDCHGDMRSYDHQHPKGTKYTPTELRRHRDAWYLKRQNSPFPAYSEASLKLDQQVFLDIKTALPYSGAIRFLEQHDFGVSFILNRLDALHAFSAKSEDPSAEFIDADLEGMRITLVKAINEFSYYLSMHTWPTHNGFQSVPPEWEESRPARHTEVVGKLNALGTAVTTAYSMLVRESRRRLSVH